MAIDIVALTAVCEEDSAWVPQYLAEVDRLRIPFIMLFDRCSSAFMESVLNSQVAELQHCQCVSYDVRALEEFNEQAKQGIWNQARHMGFDWAIAWDIDETWELNARDKIEQTLAETDAHVLTARWLNLWETPDQVRIDGGFNGHHAKFYNLQAGPWKFDHPITNGCKLLDDRGRIRTDTVTGKTDIVCLHHGMMTKELRQFHKERWDRIYTKAVGNNPYGFWNYALDETVTPQLTRNVWR